MFRDAALSAGASLHYLTRARPVSPPLVIAGLVATGGLVALAYLVGADPRPWLATGQPGVLPVLLDTFSDREPAV